VPHQEYSKDRGAIRLGGLRKEGKTPNQFKDVMSGKVSTGGFRAVGQYFRFSSLSAGVSGRKKGPEPCHPANCMIRGKKPIDPYWERTLGEVRERLRESTAPKRLKRGREHTITLMAQRAAGGRRQEVKNCWLSSRSGWGSGKPTRRAGYGKRRLGNRLYYNPSQLKGGSTSNLADGKTIGKNLGSQKDPPAHDRSYLRMGAHRVSKKKEIVRAGSPSQSKRERLRDLGKSRRERNAANKN